MTSKRLEKISDHFEERLKSLALLADAQNFEMKTAMMALDGKLKIFSINERLDERGQRLEELQNALETATRHLSIFVEVARGASIDFKTAIAAAESKFDEGSPARKRVHNPTFVHH